MPYQQIGWDSQSQLTQGNPGAPGLTGIGQYDPATIAQASAANKQSRYQYGGEFGGVSQAAQDQQNLAHIPVDAQMARFHAILPLLTGQLNKFGSGGAFTPGGSNSQAPPITTGPVLNPQQIQQQVNQSNANVDKNTATNIQQSNNNLAGRGFGSNSPLAMALETGIQNQGLSTRTGNETNLRLNAAQANAGNLLNTQQALSNQWATGNQLDINRRTPYLQAQSALLGSLAGLV